MIHKKNLIVGILVLWLGLSMAVAQKPNKPRLLSPGNLLLTGGKPNYTFKWQKNNSGCDYYLLIYGNQGKVLKKNVGDKNYYDVSVSMLKKGDYRWMVIAERRSNKKVISSGWRNFRYVPSNSSSRRNTTSSRSKRGKDIEIGLEGTYKNDNGSSQRGTFTICRPNGGAWAIEFNGFIFRGSASDNLNMRINWQKKGKPSNFLYRGVGRLYRPKGQPNKIILIYKSTNTKYRHMSGTIKATKVTPHGCH